MCSLARINNLITIRFNVFSECIALTEPMWIDRSSREGTGILLPLILMVSLILLLTAIVIIFLPRMGG